jgi:hypothetical protein
MQTKMISDICSKINYEYRLFSMDADISEMMDCVLELPVRTILICHLPKGLTRIDTIDYESYLSVASVTVSRGQFRDDAMVRCPWHQDCVDYAADVADLAAAIYYCPTLLFQTMTREEQLVIVDPDVIDDCRTNYKGVRFTIHDKGKEDERAERFPSIDGRGLKFREIAWLCRSKANLRFVATPGKVSPAVFISQCRQGASVYSASVTADDIMFCAASKELGQYALYYEDGELRIDPMTPEALFKACEGDEALIKFMECMRSTDKVEEDANGS